MKALQCKQHAGLSSYPDDHAHLFLFLFFRQPTSIGRKNMLHNSIRDNIPFDSKGGQPANRFVFNLTVKCRAIAGSFSNSFKKRQQWLGLAEELKCSTKALVVDVRTRWDYTYLTLKSFNDQEKLVKLFSLQYDVPHVLTKADWDLVKPTMYLLEPLHGFT